MKRIALSAVAGDACRLRITEALYAAGEEGTPHRQSAARHATEQLAGRGW